ncbi:hypothetical protein CDAR_609221 [Caerostris darwini]|uniref:Uncharacterized protein n=1 Tax=Caerostris darwini TaxID=1538125 RepID=A0AAV4PV11_9ARAC|nr:hypothetical protein CDAR_609221 [Caerostris darwini]
MFGHRYHVTDYRFDLFHFDPRFAAVNSGNKKSRRHFLEKNSLKTLIRWDFCSADSVEKAQRRPEAFSFSPHKTLTIHKRKREKNKKGGSAGFSLFFENNSDLSRILRHHKFLPKKFVLLSI